MTIYKATCNIKHAGTFIPKGDMIEGTDQEFSQLLGSGALVKVSAKDKKEAEKKVAAEEKAKEEAAKAAEENKPKDTWKPDEKGQDTWGPKTQPEAPAAGFETKPIGTAAEGAGEKESATGDAIQEAGTKTSPDDTGENL